MNDGDLEARISVVTTLAGVSPPAWDTLAAGHPALAHAYLHALHESGSATASTGWQPRYLLLTRGEVLAGAVPLYLKTHSYGEYVFDWAWAEAYARHGLEYYPKLLVAVPFTPVTGPRLLAADDEALALLARALAELTGSEAASSVHVLFAQDRDAEALRANGFSERVCVQFHWFNHGYTDFDHFLGAMNHDKRKRIRQERRRVTDSGVTFRRKVGDEITLADWDFFYLCYCNTYRTHGSRPYLTRDFFARIATTLSDCLMLAVGSRDGEPIAASFCLFSRTHLYGRYWGTTLPLPGLHFEACYYQSIEFAIERGLQVFEGGAQGEHKLARGLTAVPTRSFHRLSHPAFAEAVDHYLERERGGMHRYLDELGERSPFK
jgi:hypothetical protein